MKLTCSKVGAVSVLKLEDRMDAQAGPVFERACADCIAAGEKVLVVDLGSLGFISSAGLRSILVMGKRLKEAGGSLRFCGLGGVVKHVFEASGFTAIFPVFDSVEAAVK